MSNLRFLNKNGESQAHLAAPEAGTREQPDLSVDFSGSEIRALLEGLLDVVVKSSGAVAGAVRMLSADGRELHIAGSLGLTTDARDCEDHVRSGCGVCGKAAHGDAALSTADAKACATLSGSRFFGTRCQRVVAIPLEHHGIRVGVFNLFFDDQHEISNDTARTLHSFAEMIGVSIENARLAGERRRNNLISERQAIANEIHDTLAQTLAFGRMRMSVLQEAMRKGDEILTRRCLEDVNEALDNGKKAARELITHFRSQMDPKGLGHALQVLAGDFTARTGIALDYSSRVVDLAIPMEHELQVFQIVREALSNIATHSGASQAWLQISREGDRYVFAMKDDGAGMTDTTAQEGHYGLTIMRERALQIGAEIEMESEKGQGTRIRLILAAS